MNSVNIHIANAPSDYDARVDVCTSCMHRRVILNVLSSDVTLVDFSYNFQEQFKRFSYILLLKLYDPLVVMHVISSRFLSSK